MRRFICLFLVCIIIFSCNASIFAMESMPFIDVKEEDTFFEALVWAKESKIVNGDGNSLYMPNKELTLGQMTMILSRFLGNDFESDSWVREQEICANYCVKQDIMPSYYLEDLSNPLSFASACYFILKSEKILYPTTFDLAPNVNAAIFLNELGIIDTKNIDITLNITRGEFIELLYKIYLFDFNNIKFDEYSNYSDVIKQFGSNIIFEDSLKSIEGQRDTSDIFLMKETYYKYLSNIPYSIRQSFLDKGWKLYIGKSTLSTYSHLYPVTIGGVTDYENKRIAVVTANALYHEFGHFLQDDLGMMHSFDKYYQEGKDYISIYRSLHIDNESEYFATVFDLYVRSVYPNDINDKVSAALFKEKAPETWEFFDDLRYFCE